jgi:hypothetical protein
MKRFLALLAAVGLVAGALLVRTVIDGGTPGGGSAGGGGDDTTTLRCGPDLERVCEALAAGSDGVEVRIEAEGVTAGRLVAEGSVGLQADVWLTVGPWAEVAADDRAAAGGPPLDLGGTSPTLARSPAVIVAAVDRADALADACPTGITWACIGPFAGRPWTDVGGLATWGALRPGIAPPATGSGLTVWSQAVSSRTVSVGLPADWARNDLDDPSVSGWFDQLAAQSKRAGPGVADPLARFLVAPATYGVVGALEAAAGPAVARAAGRSDTRLIYPEPVVSAEVTVTAPAGSNVDEVLDRLGADQLARALAEAGWRVADEPFAPGVGGGPPLPTSSGLAAPGALAYLQERWEAIP